MGRSNRIQVYLKPEGERRLAELREALGMETAGVVEAALGLLRWYTQKRVDGIEISYEEGGMRKYPVFGFEGASWRDGE
jgi:hypothetical protein